MVGEPGLAVDERGIGVAAGEDERTFLPFIARRLRSRYGNRWTRLAIARRIAKAQGGTLTFARQEGGGSRFTLRLPAAVESESDVDIAPTARASIGPP